jgi:hypothetical protein
MWELLNGSLLGHFATRCCARLGGKREGVMSQESKRFRLIAARHLRKARRAVTTIERDHEIYLARMYKSLALDEERYRGEPERSRVRAGHAMVQAMR